VATSPPSARSIDRVNRLADETSPYLRQHADNPVDWFPWGEEAFEMARAEDRPIFLSIGYSACHWCHVMAHESFEDQKTAELMNESFVCIKVDREERPDVDAVYMEAVQSMTGSGGWPMSVFLTVDRRPFFGGTYFPPVDRHGQPSFSTVLAAMNDVWENRRDEVEEQADQLSEAIAQRSVIERPAGASSLFGATGGPDRRPDLLGPAIVELEKRFDPEWGGFGGAPKFPQPTLVDLALLHATRHQGSPVGSASELMATRTLDAMAAGGIHDHLGGGFARYSTDTEWLVPHFEKMLYDQAGLLRAFLHGWQVTGRENYLRTMTALIDYVTRDLSDPSGGIYSAEDADSEGVEGKFYVWTPAEVTAAIGDHPEAEALANAALDFFQITEGGNFEGSTILRRPVGAALSGPDPVEQARALLFEFRAGRIRPGLDYKILTEWNAMYASALAEAAAATGNGQWAETAVAIGEFLHTNLVGDDGRWLRSWQRDGGARHLAYAGDYAWLVDCCTRLGELTGKALWTQRATEAADGLIALFADDEGGGFFTTGNDAEALIVRTKEIFDGATPSANAVAALALSRLGSLSGVAKYGESARGVVDMFGEFLTRHPTAFPHTVLTAETLMGGLTEVVVTGDRPDLLKVVRSEWRPDAVMAWGEPTGSPLWLDRQAGQAYVCRNYACRLPADRADTLAHQLAEATSGYGDRR
jgi:uncharacterized protein YyaL (SSP411 family)